MKKPNAWLYKLSLCCGLFLMIPGFALDHTKLSQQQSERLGWQSANNLCEGVFWKQARPSMKTQQTKAMEISADEVSTPLDETWLLKGHVQLNTKDYTIWGDSASIATTTTHNKHELVTVDKRFRLQQQDSLVLADHGHFDMGTNHGKLFNSYYRLDLAPENKTHSHAIREAGWGYAHQFQQLDAQHFHANQVDYTTCSAASMAWRLHAKSIDFDRDKQFATAHHTWFYFYGLPIAYTPYISFALDKNRRTGFLTPTFGISSHHGFSFAQPFYMNLAPNYDNLLTSNWLQKRGLLLNNLSRYLTPKSQGQLQIDLLPRDQAFIAFQQRAQHEFKGDHRLPALLNSQSDRTHIKWIHHSQLSPSLDLNAAYEWASDNYFVNDILGAGSLGQTTSVASQLIQTVGTTYRGEEVSFSARIKRHQTLQQVNQAHFARPYDEMPRLSFSYAPFLSTRVTPKLNVAFTNFTLSPQWPTSPITGERLYVVPEISLPWQTRYAYFKPRLQWHISHYRLDAPPGKREQITRQIPIFHIDSGLIFERSFSVAKESYTQTLEPRLFFVNIPHRNQQGIPVFDTSLSNYYYPQLFNDNRFVGHDRIGDTRQITLGVSSRVNHAGRELGHISLGQIIETRQQQVGLCLSLGCTNNPKRQQHRGRSIWAGEVSLQPSPFWRLNSNHSYNHQTKQIINHTDTLTLKASEHRLVNLSYSYTNNYQNWLYVTDNDKETARLASLSGIFSVNSSWALSGAITRNITRHWIQDYLFGIEYNSCCWAFRVVASKAFSGTKHKKPEYNKGVFLQWRFKGLGELSTANPQATLNNHIAFYDGQWMR